MAKLLLGSVVGPQGPQGTAGADGAQGPQGIAGPSEITAATDVVGLTPGRLLYNKSGKLGSVDIVDNLLSIDPDKPLSANQGKILKGLIDDNGVAIADNTSAIGQIANDRGYITSKNVNQANINTLVSNGKYTNIAGMPATGSWVVDVISLNATFVTQYASCIYDSQGLGYTGKKLMRDNLGGTWSPWKEIATSESDILTPLNGWTNSIYTASKISKVGNVCTVSASLTGGTKTSYTQLFQIPAIYRPTSLISAPIITGSAGVFKNNAARLQATGLFDFVVNIPDDHTIIIMISYVI